MKTFEELLDDYRKFLLEQTSMLGGGYQDRRRAFKKTEAARLAIAAEYGRIKLLLAAYRPQYSARRISGANQGHGNPTVELT